MRFTKSEGVVKMASNHKYLETMPVDELWALHQDVCSALAARIEAEKRQLEDRLETLNRGVGTRWMNVSIQPRRAGSGRRPYPKVLPKYRNPSTSETWSGRGKQPRWLAAAIQAGRKADDFAIRGNAR